MAGIYDALSRGVESGFSMGRQAAQDDEAKRARKVQEERQAAEDVRRAEAHELDAQRARFGLEQAQATAARQQETRHAAVLAGEAAEIEKAQAARQAQGLPLDEGAAQRYAEIKSGLARRNQAALDFFSRAKVGQVNPMDAPGPELRMNLTAATGMLPEELPMVRAGAADIEAGMETANWGLVTQGVNKAMVGQLKRGVGTPSPYGGTITRKEIIGLDPAVDAAGNEHPNRFIPRLRVYVEGVSPTGGEMYYDAPMTQNGSTEETDKVVAIDIKKGMDWLANVKMLAEMAERPDVKAKLAPGPNDEAKRYIEQLRTLTAPQTKLVSAGGQAFKQTGSQFEALGPKPETPAEAALREQREAAAAVNRARVDGTLPAPKRAGGGSGGGGSGGGADKPSMTADAIQLAAEQYLAGDKTVLQGMSRGGKQGVANLVAIRDEVARQARAKGMSGRDIALRMQEFMGLGAAQRTLGNRQANFGMAKAEADEMADIVLQTSEAYGRTNFQPINKALNAWETNTGGTEIRQFGAAINSFINAYARAISPVGQVTVSDKNHARELLSAADSPAQVRAVMATLKQEMEAAGRAPGRVKEDLRTGFREGTGGAAPAAGGTLPPEAVRALKEGQVTTFRNGQRWTLRGGQPVQVQ